MSFDMNLISKNLSNVQASSKSQDGGAGNTGYFKRKKKEEELSIHFKESVIDSFDKVVIEEEDEEDVSLSSLILKFIETLIEKVKKIFNAKA